MGVTEYIKGGHLQCKRRNGQKGFVPYLPPDSVKIKIPSKPLLPQGEGVLARASLTAARVQCRPDSPRENLSVGVGPARQPRSPLAFPSGGWATFPMRGTVPHN